MDTQTILQEVYVDMKDLKKNILDQYPKIKAVVSKTKRKLLKNVWLVRLTIVILIAGILVLVGSGLKNILAGTKFAKYAQLARAFVIADRSKLKTINGKVNLIILGKGGKGHEAPDLTDTIIFTSVDTNTSQVGLVSLPRDIWLPELRAKLNSAYYWGNKKQDGGGMPLAKSSVEGLVGQPIQYAIVLDFSGFEKIIDALGGVNVYIERTFVDEKYPIPGKENDLCNGDREFKCRYERLEFSQGWHQMDGATALKFARSRHAEGDEGTDIARSQRQQKIIGAIKNKALSKEVLMSPKKVISLYEAVMSAMETDMTDEELMILARYIVDSRDNLKSQVLPEELLVNPPVSQKYDYQYVFIPKDGTWKSFQMWINEFLK